MRMHDVHKLVFAQVMVHSARSQHFAAVAADFSGYVTGFLDGDTIEVLHNLHPRSAGGYVPA